MMVLVAGIVTMQADDSAWTVVEAVDARELTQQSEWLDYRLSPDGSTLAWEDGGELCLFTIADAQTTCQPTPESLTFGVWSPDSQYLLFADSSISFSSVWVYSRRSERFIHLAEIQAGMRRPIWHPVGSTVYFLTYDFLGGKDTYLLHRHALDSGEETVFDLPDVIPEDIGGRELAAISLDGTQILLHDEGGRAPGLWLVDITEQRLEQLATYEELRVGLPDWVDTYLVVGDVVWDTETNQVIVSMITNLPQFRTFTLTRIDMETRTFTQLLDYSSYRDPPDDNTADRLGIARGYITPDAALFFSYDFDEFFETRALTAFALPLDSPSSEPLVVTTNYTLDCVPTPLLVTMQRQGEIRRYLFDLYMLCPG